ncbi:PREDICTED: spondin-1-like [Acropora digitifera]|uniref:spondin-1-like n=1 Tax=Acropora digitifera TaxID=70779 RepID=UPI00077A0586|nr:PREDICTED: spondin-1-like [Acropora digitifera]
MVLAQKAAAILVLLILVIDQVHHCSAWRRRRRRCTTVHCSVTTWSDWTSCSASTCGRQGSQSRSRSITTNPSCGGDACPNLRESRLCYGSRPQNCQLSSWSYWWSSCSASTCGREGSQTRSRSIITHASCGGNTCPSNLRESRLCYGSRAENCQLSSWSEWSACLATRCGSSAIQTRIRHRITTEKCGGWCTTTFRKSRWCFRRPVNCKLSSWSEWNTCNGTVCTAGNGTEVSFRHKIIKETCGGTCPSTFKTRSCFNFINRTAVECQVSPWSEWGDCKRTSCQLEGIQTKTRNKTVKEECQGTCKYALHQTKLCTQSQLPCFNGGKYKPNITGCACVHGYYGVCCEKSPYFQGSSRGNRRTVTTIAATSSGGIFLVIVILVCYKRSDGVLSIIRSCLCLA